MQPEPVGTTVFDSLSLLQNIAARLIEVSLRNSFSIMVHEPKKSFYKKFLYEPFPVESSLLDALPDHLNAEIVAGSLKTKQDVVDYITWTYFFRRLLQNPSYYGLDDTSDDALNKCELICIEGSLSYKFFHLTLILYYNNAGFLRPL